MKKVLSVIYVVLLLSTVSYAQATVTNEILVADNDGGSKLLLFGLDSTATDGIDVHLDESDLPPFPPVGAFEARFFLPENGFTGSLGSYKDFRNATFPFTGQKEFRLAYQLGTGSAIIISWNFPTNVTGLLQDLFGGIIVNVPISGSGSYQVVTGIDRLKLFITYDAVVPVELTSFTSSVIGSTVQLNWSTASEINNSGFDIERKLQNSSEWQKIGFVPGAGTTAQSQSYAYTDEPGTGMYEYRLRQVDFDGTFAYSQIVSAEVGAPTKFELNQNYPNPFNPSTTIKYSIPAEGYVKLSVFNTIGQELEVLVSEFQTSGTYEILWTADNYSSGVYFYQMEVSLSDGKMAEKQMKKLVLIK